ncbi:MAG: N-acetyltransferase, partial [Spirochaetia bacterium]|nr:N-acetyltransferase [Spirochaetia bacterium]
MEEFVESFQGLVVREFKEEDLNQVADVLLNSFQSKFYPIKNFDKEKQIQFLIDSSFVSDHPFDGYIVAEYRQQVVGVMSLNYHGQKKGTPNKKTSLFELIKNYGFIPVIKMYSIFSLLEEKVPLGQVYIEHIAVKEEARGLSIGTTLLKYSLSYTKETLHLPSTSLYVASSNTRAKQLYEKLGFVTKGKRKSVITKIAFHEKSWFYMRYDHDGYDEKIVMKKGWYLGFVGLLGVPYLHNLLLVFKGEGSLITLLGLLWFLMFSMFIPEKRK